MDVTVKVDILKVLDASLQMIERNDVSGLKELSNHTIHNASIFQDDDSIAVAVIMYTLAKIFERARGVDKSVLTIILDAKRKLLDDNLDGYHKYIKKLYSMISKRDSRHKMYIQEVIRQAGVKKSSKIYEHGISMARAAGILGVSQWELMNYVGQTKIADSFREPINLKKRLSIARNLFGG